LVIIGTKSDLAIGLDEEDLSEEFGIIYNASKQVKRRKNIAISILKIFSRRPGADPEN
jgi:hypothetical protein